MSKILLTVALFLLSVGCGAATRSAKVTVYAPPTVTEYKTSKTMTLEHYLSTDSSEENRPTIVSPVHEVIQVVSPKPTE